MWYKAQEWRHLIGERRVLIAGYGREGRSSEALLSQLLPQHQFAVADGTENILHLAPDYDLILKSPGIPTMVFEDVCDLSKISSQTDLFLQIYAPQSIGITGTKGKSTTTKLIYDILQCHLSTQDCSCLKDYSVKDTECFCDGRVSETCCFSEVMKAGNMGIPLFDIVPRLTPQTLVVAELSCHQLENIHRAPHISVLLNLFQEHLDHYHDYDDYKNAKLNIFRYQQSGDIGFYCSDNKELSMAVKDMSAEVRSQLVSYDVSHGFDVDVSPSLQGKHNRSNLTVAAAVAHRLGVSDDTISQTAKSFKGLPYRMEYVGCFRGIHFYDDSISTIPEAAMAAVNAIPNVDTLILGGFDRGIDYGELVAFLTSSSIRNLVFVGAAGRRMLDLYRQILPADSDSRNIIQTDDYAAIVPWCYSHTAQGKVCLLSPAASSYDAFKNFEERGCLFNKLVSQYQ